MSRWRDSTFVLWWRRHAPWGACLLLVLLALAWRLPHALFGAFDDQDEVWYSLPTAERMARGEWLLYISGTNYGAPVQEFFSSLLIRLFGTSAATLRLPVVVMGSLAIVVAYLSLRNVVRGRVAFAFAVLLACADSAVTHYTTFSHPAYATVFLLCGAIQLLAFRLARERTAACWLALAVAMGTAFCVFKLSLLQSVAALAWLWWRSENAARFREHAGTVRGARTLKITAALFVAGAALLAPVAYHYLTRRRTFVIAPWEKGLLLAASVPLFASAVLAIRATVRLAWRELWPPLACAAALVLIPLPAALWYARIEAPRVAARHGELYSEASYELKHLHAFPHQVRLVIQGIIPALLIGRFNELEGEPTETEPLDWRAGLSIALLVSLVWFGGKRMRAAGWRVPLSAPDVVLIAPFLLTAAVMFPSWALHSECCFRYLMPFLPGGLLLIYRALQEPITRHPRITGGVIAAVILQNAWDCYWHML